MAFNKRGVRNAPGSSPVQTGMQVTGRTFNGAPGFGRDPKSELFLLGTTTFFGQDNFYEKGNASAARFVNLVREVTKADPQWTLDFITWLRSEGNIRSASVVASVEAARVAKDFQFSSAVKPDPQATGWGRKLAQAGIQRPDEIGEAIAYYTSTHGKRIPKPIKRGLADVLTAKTTEFSVLKYDSPNKGWRLADLINLLHPTPKAPWQDKLFGYVVAKAYGEVEIPEGLDTLRARKSLMGLDVRLRRELLGNPGAADLLKQAGMTWEALAGWLQGPMDKVAWEAILSNMGVMAQIRNLRNFDQAGVSDRAIAPILAKLMDAEEVAKSKQLPFRFLSAYRNAPSVRWHYALAKALDFSVANIPAMPGRTLILVDTSGSMDAGMSEHGDVKRWDIAALFGIALAKRMGTVNVVSYSSNGWTGLALKEFQLTKGAEVLTECERWKREGFNIGGGTPTGAALKATYMDHDRVIILTDEQADRDHNGLHVGTQMRADRPLYTCNLAGYRNGHAAGSPYRHTFGGLTDAMFTLIPAIEAGLAGNWPWNRS